MRAETRIAWLAMIDAAEVSPISELDQNNLRRVTRLAFYSPLQSIDFEIRSLNNRARLVSRKTRSVEYLMQHALYEHVLLVRDYRDSEPEFISTTPGFSFVERIGPILPPRPAIRSNPLRKFARKLIGKIAKMRYAIALRVLNATGYSRRFRDAWLLSDRREQASDNAEALVRYLTEHRPDINAWFVLDPKVPAYQRLQADGVKILPYRSMRHFVLAKHARQIVSSQVDKISMQPFAPRVLGREFSFTYLKHGVVHTDHFRRFNPKLIDLIIASTQDEYRRFTEEGGGYRFVRDGVQLTGMPRHDLLMRALERLKAEGVPAPAC
ncbi:CDP-glycerol glycerophosphotransferase family protein [Leucobacter soli]|uniref:CDP-glycerol glycerophosphotransferase family protein n=1 Tax=Leucobacter soli TaxID=2812850 RepID=UPI00361EFF31